MDDDPVQLLFKDFAQQTRIFPYAGNTDVDISFNKPGFTQAESDNVRKRVVFEVLLVDGKQVLVAAKNIVQIPEGAILSFNDLFDPGSGFTRIGKSKSRFLVEVVNAGH